MAFQGTQSKTNKRVLLGIDPPEADSHVMWTEPWQSKDTSLRRQLIQWHAAELF